MVTFWHFTSPRWFAGLGEWENPGAGDLFARYAERASKHLGDLIGAATTFNEPNIPAMLQWLFARMPQNPFQGAQAMHQQAARAMGAERFSSFMLGDAASRVKVPVYVTENGIGTADDTRRVEYIRGALAGVRNCLDDKIDVRGYIHLVAARQLRVDVRLPAHVRARRREPGDAGAHAEAERTLPRRHREAQRDLRKGGLASIPPPGSRRPRHRATVTSPSAAVPRATTGARSSTAPG